MPLPLSAFLIVVAIFALLGLMPDFDGFDG
jgi:hypothetical protein